MIRDSVGEVDGLFLIRKEWLQHAAVEGLVDGVCGDEAEAPGLLRGEEFGGFLPPEHDEVRRLGDFPLPCFPQAFRVAIAQRIAHPRGSDERRIPHDVIRLRPFGAFRVRVVEEVGAGAFVGDFLAGDGVGLGAAAVPDGDVFPGVGIAARDFLVVGEHGVAALDGVVLGEERSVVGIGFPGGTAVELEVADPEDDLGDGGGAGVELDAEEVVRADDDAGHLQGAVAAEFLEEVEHLGLQAFHQLQGDVEEIPGAAGGIEHADGGEFLVEGADGGAGFLALVLVIELGGGGADGLPFLAEGIDQGRADEALDVAARGVVRAELVPLAGIERPFQQGAEDGGLDAGPILLRGMDEVEDLVRAQGEDGAVLE